MRPQKRQRRSLSWGPEFLTHHGQAMLDRLTNDDGRKLFSYLQSLEWNWASGCSGTDSPAWVFRALQACMANGGTQCCCPHEASAEIDARKREFILDTSACKTLLADIWDFIAEHPRCYRTGRRTSLRKLKRSLRMFLAGFSCKDASCLSNNGTGTELQDGSGIRHVHMNSARCIHELQIGLFICVSY